MDDELRNEIIKTIAHPAMELIHKIYEDALQPGVQEVGKAIGGLLGLGNTVLLPVHLLNGYSRIVLQGNFEKFRRKLEDIPPEKVIPVAPVIGVPILEKFSYLTDETLSEMFMELLAKASNKDQKNMAHPGFISIIERMSSEDATTLKRIGLTKSIFRIYRFISENPNALILADKWIYDIEDDEKVDFASSHSISNLYSLGLFETRPYIPGLSEDNEKKYKELCLEKFKINPLNYEIDNIHIYGVSPLGRLFIRTCIEDLPKINSEK